MTRLAPFFFLVPAWPSGLRLWIKALVFGGFESHHSLIYLFIFILIKEKHKIYHFSHLQFLKKIYLFIVERKRDHAHEWEGQKERERGSQADPSLSTDPKLGLIPRPRDHDLRQNPK